MVINRKVKSSTPIMDQILKPYNVGMLNGENTTITIDPIKISSMNEDLSFSEELYEQTKRIKEGSWDRNFLAIDERFNDIERHLNVIGEHVYYIFQWMSNGKCAERPNKAKGKSKRCSTNRG